MHAFRRLLVTELRNRRNMTIITVGAGILLNAVFTSLMLRGGTGNLALIMVINFMVFAFLLLFPLLHCFLTWREEWKQHAIYQLLSLPVPRTYLLISKYISILLEITMIIVVMMVGLWIQYRLSGGLLFRVEPLISFDWSKAQLIGTFFFGVTSFVFICFMSVFLGKWSSSVSLLVTFVTFVVSLLIGIIAFANFPTLLTLVVLSLVCFFVNYYLLERRASV